MPVIVFLVLLILRCRKCYNKNLNLFLVLADIVSSESQSFYLFGITKNNLDKCSCSRSSFPSIV